MLGDERVRFCMSCEKNVYNLSAMAREDAERLLQERVGKDLCVRFHQRADGTILTEDCPVGVKKKRRKKLALAVAGAGAMAFAATTMQARSTCVTTGAIAVQGELVDEPVMGNFVEPQPTPSWRMGDVGEPSDPTPIPHVMGTATAEAPPPPPAKTGRPALPKSKR